MIKKFFIPLLVLLTGAVAAVYFYAGNSDSGGYDIKQAVPVETFRLRNGLTVVVMPNARIPAVVHALFVRAGGADDPYGKSGLAHFVEHLLFTGTKDHPEGEYDRAIARLGGQHNAYTTQDYTAFYVAIAREYLANVMALESDRLQHLVLDEARATREVGVIEEERKWRVDNRLPALLAEQMNAVLLLNHPYRQPLIGWAEDIARFRVEDAKHFLARHYRPSNMVLVVAGDVTVEDVRKLAQQYYAPLRAGVAPTRHWPAEPMQVRAERRVTLRDARAEQTRLVVSYLAPSTGFGDPQAGLPLALFVHYLGGSDTGFLYRRLVEEQKLASLVTADYDTLAVGPGVVTVAMVPAEGVTVDTLERAYQTALAEALQAPPPAAAITRTKTLLKAGAIFAQDGLEPLAHLMGQLYMLGLDEGYFYHWPDKVEQITAEAMMAAARATLRPPNSVVGVLTAEGAEPPAAPAASTAAADATEAPYAR
jgi:zinc protease